MFVTFALFLGGDISWLRDDPAVIIASITFTTGIWFVSAQSVFAPFIGISVIAELSRLKSLIIYLLGGGVCALVFLLFPHNGVLVEPGLPYSNRELWLTILSAGFFAGFVHWALAGHRAGIWLGSVRTENQA